ncbi:Uncharacterized protein HZ326_5192 [Fusarium oxysporum f. sp. albedinis]|nr:Uncharacterized protein HZ326_5192 [Fusarium oxysporum f. sp. albedinis]
MRGGHFSCEEKSPAVDERGRGFASVLHLTWKGTYTLCPDSGKCRSQGQGSMIVVDAERSRWCVVSDKTGKVLDANVRDQLLGLLIKYHYRSPASAPISPQILGFLWTLFPPLTSPTRRSVIQFKIFSRRLLLLQYSIQQLPMRHHLNSWMETA